MSDVTFESVAPVIFVRDLDAALDRYRRLGFTVHAYGGPERYGFAERGSVSLHLAEWHDHAPAHRPESEVYLYVSDADAVHAEWAAAGVDGRLGEPSDRPWGLREFGFVDTDGTLHRVGSPLTSR
jgi:catechol 2,3-dioxygenase-like lactoylglutathione lyase family enzyme